MTTSRIIAHDDAAFADQAARLFLEKSAAAIAKNGRFTVALSGGTTPRKFYERLASDYYRSRLDWPNIYLFWADERCVPPQDPQSNYGFVKKILLSRVYIPEANVFRMAGEMTPSQLGARMYEQMLRSFFHVDLSVPKLDLIVLGLGEDGHTASLFPGTDAAKEKEKLVTFVYIPALNSYRLTLTLPVINNAATVLFMASGESKAGIVRDVFRSDISPHRYPAQDVQPTAGELIWLLDLTSASKLPPDIIGSARHV